MTTEERLTKLEEDLSTAKRRNRWTLASAALVLVAVVTAGNIRPPADEVKARRFTVVDAQGNTRAAPALQAVHTKKTGLPRPRETRYKFHRC